MQRKFDIITDSGCDMPKSYLDEKGVACVNLGFTMNNIHYAGEEGEQITAQDFYQKLREGGMPTTYQVTAETAKKYMLESLEKERDILVIAFSSGLSGTADSFIVALRELSKKYRSRKIIVVDSLCASMGEGLLLDYVIAYAESGATMEQTAKYAEQLKGKICHQFTVDNLFHLKRGGRISSMSAIVGSILKIKPIMKVDDNGKLVVTGKAVGRKKAIKTLVENAFASMDIQPNERIFISHGDCLEDVDYAVRLLKERLPNTPITIGYVGAVIGSHSGVGTLAIFYKGKGR